MSGYSNHKEKLTFLLMAGFPGTGKTTLANELKKNLGWVLIDKDRIKEDFMYKGLSDEDAAWQAYEKAFAKASISLNITKRSVILDSSAMRHFVWEEAKRLAHNFGADLKVLHCIADNDVRMQRLQKREALISQQNSSTFTIEANLAQFVHLPQNTQIVYTDQPVKEYFLTAKEYVTKY